MNNIAFKTYCRIHVQTLQNTTKNQDKIKEYVKQVVSNYSNFISNFHTIIQLLKIMDACMTNLAQKL